MADSLIRLQRIQTSIADDTTPATVASLHTALSDHADFPSAVCCHPDLREAHPQQWATVLSVIMDLDEQAIYLSDGNPCQHPARRLTFDGLLDKPSSLALMRARLDVDRPSAS